MTSGGKETQAKERVFYSSQEAQRGETSWEYTRTRSLAIVSFTTSRPIVC